MGILNRKPVIFASLVLFSAAAVFAQTSSLEGDVKDENGKPIKDALVKITRTDIKGSYKVKTDKKGHYFHAGLPLGNYDITVEVDGKDRDTVHGVRSKLGDPTAVNFDLKAKAVEAQALQKAAETGTLTKEQERGMSAEQKAALEKQMKERQQTLAKNKALNEAFNAGKTAMDAKQWDVAVQSFQKAGELDPNQHVVWANLADSYAQLAKTKTGAEQADIFTKAGEAYQKAIAIKGDDSAYHNNYALMLANARKFDEAQAELNKAAQLDPPQAGKFFYNLGAVLTNTGQTEPAEAAFKKAIDADPTYADAQFQYATALSAKLKTGADGSVTAPPGFKEALEKYLQLKPDGQFAEAAKGMLQMVGAKVQTTYENPNAPANKKAKKK